nr:RNA-directed DNA polymerase, eukaryota [Tanacetum cinerariifolium]
MLWDYLSLVMSKWEGEVVIMGDFNEVCNKSERFGTLFNRHGADVFNRFISNAGLEDVPLEGCSFTLCQRSATKINSWKDTPIIESNALVRMMKKLKYLKEKSSERSEAFCSWKAETREGEMIPKREKFLRRNNGRLWIKEDAAKDDEELKKSKSEVDKESEQVVIAKETYKNIKL